MNTNELKVGNIYWHVSYLDGAQEVRYESETDGLLMFSIIDYGRELHLRNMYIETDIFKTEIGAVLAGVALVDPFDSETLSGHLERLRYVAESMPHFRAVFYANQIDECPR